ncbi:hypothetical protein OEZ85_003736 [Tetradesmus obliquus]|uniref:U-box domain-containing protein n=1 Tax=Tetradesmus obliquus TaxID=3088 RepID=A0ABY8UDF4_TETOB|nr:hypothetical protein OEZ85_003736 [Tetradesmus obliquus]
MAEAYAYLVESLILKPTGYSPFLATKREALFHKPRNQQQQPAQQLQPVRVKDIQQLRTSVANLSQQVQKLQSCSGSPTQKQDNVQRWFQNHAAAFDAPRSSSSSSSGSARLSSCCMVPPLEYDASDEEQRQLEDEAPGEFLCPIGRVLMTDPVCTPSGFTYQRSFLEDFLAKTGHDPARDTPLNASQLYPNIVMRDQIATWLQQNGIAT